MCQEIVSDDTYWSLTAVFESPEWLYQNVRHVGTLVFRIHRNQVFLSTHPLIFSKVRILRDRKVACSVSDFGILCLGDSTI